MIFNTKTTFSEYSANIPANISKTIKTNRQLVHENIVRMSRSRFATDGEFDFSKVKLNDNTINSTQSDKIAAQSEVKFPIFPDKAPPTFAPVHRFDFLTLTIPFLCLLSVTVIIFLVNMFKTSLLSSPSPGLGYRYSKSKHALTPDIHIIEPSNSAAAKEVAGDAEQDVDETELIYLTPLLNGTNFN